MLRLSPLLACLMATTPALAQTEIATARGPAEVPAAPAPLAVYNFAALDTLDAIGVAPEGTPGETLLPYLEDVVAESEDVGTLFEPDLEALNALGPELVVVGGRSAAQYDAVSQVATAIDMTIPGDEFMATARERLATYGNLFDREAEAEEVAAALDAKIETAREAVAGKGDALFVLTNGPKVSAYGAGSRFGWLHTALDLPQAAEGLEAGTHGEAISFEFIRDADPDWLIVLDRVSAIDAEGARAEQTLDNALVAETTAWAEDQVVYLPPAETYVGGGGVQAISAVLDSVIEGFGDPAS